MAKDRLLKMKRQTATWDSSAQRLLYCFGIATQTDNYYAKRITELLQRWVKIKDNMYILKLDLWNEATATKYLSWFTRRNMKAVGIDISSEVIERAKVNFKDEDGSRLSMVLCDMKKLPFKENTFDIVFSVGTIEHVDEMDEVMNESVRVLKPEGMVIAAVPNLLNVWLWPVFRKIFLTLGMIPYGDQYFFTHRKLRRMYGRAGLENIEIMGAVLVPQVLRGFERWLILKGWKRGLRLYKFVSSVFLKLLEFIETSNTCFNRYFADYLVARGEKK